MVRKSLRATKLKEFQWRRSRSRRHAIFRSANKKVEASDRWLVTKVSCCRLKLLKLRTKVQQGQVGDEAMESSPLKDGMMSDRRGRRAAISRMLKQALAAKQKAREAHLKPAAKAFA